MLLLLTGLLHVALSTTSPALAAACNGDEQILLAPAVPRVGGQLIVAAFSRTGHERAILLGPAGPLAVERVPIGDQFVWQGMLQPDHAGQYVFAFGVANGAAPLSTCADATVLVLEPDPSALTPAPVLFGTPGPETVSVMPPADPADDSVSADSVTEADAPATDGESPRSVRRATRTPTPRPNNENDNGNQNDNVAPTKTPTRTPTRVPTATRTPRPQATDTPEPTPTLAPASISSISPSRAVCGQPLTIRGARFGDDRGDVDGSVNIDGRDTSVTGWDMDEVRVTVPVSVRAGNSRLLEVVVAGRSTTKEIAISC